MADDNDFLAAHNIDESDDPKTKDGPDQVDHLNKQLLLAFQTNLLSGTMKNIVPNNNRLETEESDEEWADNGESEDPEERRRILSNLRAFIATKEAEFDSQRKDDGDIHAERSTTESEKK